MIEVRRCTIAELEAAPNLPEVLAEYAAESSIVELGPTNVQVPTYRALEASGMFHPIAAFKGSLLVGFILPIVIVLPHYGVLAATVESFFVLKAERENGVGLRLLAAAKALAKDRGAKAMLLSAPKDGALAHVLGRMSSYRHTNDVFITALA